MTSVHEIEWILGAKLPNKVHPVHPAIPLPELYEPAAQRVQGKTWRPVPVPYEPGSQATQVDTSVAPTVREYVPAAQGRQLEFPGPGFPTPELYVPATQDTQVEESGIPLAVLNVPDPQAEQSVPAVMPTPVPYAPAMQVEHTVFPVWAT